MKLTRILGALALGLSLFLQPALATEQASYVNPIAGPMPMSTFVGTYLNPALRAIATCHWGPSAPANGPSSLAATYQCWADTTTNPTVFKLYDGASWVAQGSLNTTTHAWTPYLTGGVSGGVAFFSATNIMGTSALLANHGFMVGGGAGAAPATIAACTDDQIAFGVSSSNPLCRTVTGDVTFATGVSAIGSNKVSNSMLRQSGALAVVGRSANSTGNVADIQATAAGDGVLRENGSTIGFGTVATGGIANNAVTLAKLATQAANTALVNATSGSAVPTAFAMPSCSTSASALIWTSNSGFGCNTAIAVSIANVTSLGTGVATALGVNVGSAGSPLVNGGVLGTPSSGILTNATGLPIGSGVSGLGTGVATALGNTVNASGGVVTSTRSLSTGCGLAGGGDLSADRTLRISFTINPQTGTTYTVLDGDCGKLVSFSNASSVAVTLPQANGSTFISGWTVDFQNKGAGTVTITPTTSTINGGSSLALTQNQGAHCDSDGTNYTCVLGVGAGAGSGTVTNVATSDGLSGGPITATGTLSADPLFFRSYISGLTLSTAGSSSTFGIAAGVAVDSANVGFMKLASAYTKTTSAWVVGSGNGAMDTGAVANSTWYHVHLIKRTDTGVVDVLFSLSATSPTMPTNYTLFRRIGSMKTDGSAKWTLFLQTEETFMWSVPVHDVSGVAMTAATPANQTLTTVPTGVKVQPVFVLAPSNTGNTVRVRVYSPDQADSNLPNNADGGFSAAGASSVTSYNHVSGIFTDTSARLRFYTVDSNATLDVYINGWVDSRGRFN
jgi:hypothetical protein